MPIKIEAFVNSDDVFIAWRSPQLIPDCIGFELRRKLNGKLDIMQNRVSFSSGEPDPNKPETSETSPIRRYAWTDHQPNKGDKVSYQVVPVIQSGSAAAQADESQASPFSDEMELTGQVSKSFECYFNRGLVISQFMSKYLKGDLGSKSLSDFKNSLNDQQENQIRLFLGGDLRQRLVDMLDATNKNGGHIFLAMFELSDGILLDKLTALGKRAHVVLSNGAHKNRNDDENKAGRATLKKAGCDVHDRMMASGCLGHNKFAVVCDSQQKPTAALSGSTNWSPTGVCTQINNIMLFDDPGVANIFMQQWNRLRDAGNDTPKDLVAANSQVKSAKTSTAGVNVWFTKSSAEQEMDAANKLIAGAQQGIIFLMFQPGGSSMLDAIVKQQATNKNLFVKGVISTADSKQLNKAQVTLVQRAGQQVQQFRIVQPQGLHGVGKWAAEVMRGQFLHQIGFAIVHSKVIIIDPNGDNPIVITGSHNFSASASQKNDENMVIIQGDRALAKAYAVQVQSVFDHYNFRAVAKTMQEEGKDVVTVMKDPKSWQQAWFQGDKALELNFWLGATGQPAARAATPAAPVAATSAAPAAVKSKKHAPAKAKKRVPAKAKKRAPAKAKKHAPAKAKKRAPAKPKKHAPAKAKKRAPAKAKKHAPAKAKKHAPAKAKKRAPAKPKKRAPAKPKKRTPARSAHRSR
jgi:phosphatidylserine/phosphatidylglycerophosphate/cardiolipin synthase-like enzyme